MKIAMSLIGVAAIAGSATAAPLNLLLEDSPDIISGFINVGYNSTTDTLSMNGFALDLDTGSGIESIAGGVFDLSATIDGAGNASAGTLNISGTIASLGFNSGTLLTGTIAAFGFVDAGGDPLEFLFTVTGGDAAGLYGGTAGVIAGGTGFTGSFLNDFKNPQSSGSADTAPPVPAPAALSTLALAGFFGRRRR